MPSTFPVLSVASAGSHRARPLRRLTMAWSLPALALLALTFTACGAANRSTQASQLRIRKVVLFQNGVGYFERRGIVDGDQLDLHVRPDQINDVLKSLTILHLSEGRTSSVTLPVEQSADRLAAELPAAVRNARGLVSLLQVLRGVDATVSTRDDDYRGRVVGVEKAEKKGESRVTLLVGDKKLVAIDIDKVKKVRIHDLALASGLRRSLEISRSEGSWKPVTLTVHLDGDHKHDLLVGYIHEVPIWRPAYRAWVEKGRGVRLQGWAIVDNVSGEAWDNVRLSLVVGSPLSFRYELHKPHHVLRPDLSSRLPTTAAAPPPPDVGYASKSMAYDGAVEESMADDARESAPNAAGAAPMRKSASRTRSRPSADFAPRPAPSAPPMEPDVDIETRRAAIERSAQAMAAGKRVGQLYSYDALAPVTVGDGQAALVHILNKKVDGADVFLFRDLGTNTVPYRALLIENPKGAAMESGPITLYVDGSFAGEGFLGRIDEGATTFVPFAAADGFALRSRLETRTAEVKLARAHAGRLVVEHKQRQIHTVTIRSERDQPSVCFAKMALNSSMKLEAEPKGLVRAGNDVYLRIEVPAKGEGSAEIVEVTQRSVTSMWTDPMVLEAFALFLKDTTADESLKGPIRELIALQQQLASATTKRAEVQQRRNEIDREAQRIRHNLDSLPLDRVADKLRKTLVNQLEENTKAAAEAAKSVVEADVEIAAIREKMTGLIKQIELK
jgi:hypothetical protein